MNATEDMNLADTRRNLGTGNSTQTSTEVESELQAKANWLRERIKTSITDAKVMKLGNRKKASIIKVANIGLSGLATILLGIQIVGFDPIFRNIAFVLVSIVTLLNAAEPFFNFRAHWVESEIAKASFHRLKDDLEYYLAGTKTEDLSAEVLDDFHERMQAIWNRFGESWSEHRQSNRFNV